MTVISLGKGFYVKSRPKSYKASDAAYPVGGNQGFVIASLPKEYPLTSQQKKVRDAAHTCGIKKGISKATLQKAMVDCIPGKF
jgi:hypothetical protein